MSTRLLYRQYQLVYSVINILYCRIYPYSPYALFGLRCLISTEQSLGTTRGKQKTVRKNQNTPDKQWTPASVPDPGRELAKGPKAPLRKPSPVPPLHGPKASFAPWGLFVCAPFAGTSESPNSCCKYEPARRCMWPTGPDAT